MSIKYSYDEFLKRKVVMAEKLGFDVELSEINPLLKPHQKDIVRWMVSMGRAACFAAFGLGKCHGAGTKILMHDCSIKNVEDIKVGDQIMGDDGSPRNVLSLARGKEQMYRITLKNGDSYTCNESHILSLCVSNKFGDYAKGDIVNMSLHDWLKLPEWAKKNCFKNYKSQLDWNYKDVTLDPYLYGAWLGDGHYKSLSWTINDKDTVISDRIKDFANEKDLKIREYKQRGCTTVFLSRKIRGRKEHCEEFYFVQESGKNGKRICKDYLINSREVRLQLLAGLIDTDGHLIDKCYEIATKWIDLRDDILFLCRSLGFAVSHREKIVNDVTYYRIWISGNTSEIPCLTRKKCEARKQIKNPLVYGFDVEPLGVGDYYGFEIDGNHLYLLNDFTVTHNTFIQLEALKLTLKNCGSKGLIVIPLGVRQEFMRDAEMLGIPVKFIRRNAEAVEDGIYLTNYESVRDGKLDPREFNVASLDEAACLRGMGGTKTFREFMALFAGDRKTMDNRILGESVKYRFVATATPSPNEYIELLAYSAFLGVMDVGQSKAQPLDAKVLTPLGWKPMGHISQGDDVIAGDGSVTKVIATYPQGEKEIFKITFSDGSTTEATADHLWLTKTLYERNNERRYYQRNPEGNRKFSSVKTTEEISKTLKVKGGLNHSVPLPGPIEFTKKQLPIHPWLLGALIGDACLRDTSIVFSTGDDWMRNRVCNLVPEGLFLRETEEGSGDYGITATGKQGGNGPGSNPLLLELRQYGLLGKRSFEKSIPDDYLMSSVDDRVDLLRGLMDTDGTVSKQDGQTTLCTTSLHLANQVVGLVRSLGGIATIRSAANCELTRHQAYLVEIRTPFCPFSLPRKSALFRKRSIRSLTRYVVSVESVGTKPAQCIAIEHPSRLYITDDFVVTHNTRFFKRDSTKADKLTLHAHKEEEFWLWVASWGLFVQKPSDLGHSDEGYALPELEIHWHEIPNNHEEAGFDYRGQGLLVKEQAIGIVESAKEKRDSLPKRIKKMMEIREINPDANRIIWHDLEAERHAIKKAIPSCAVVYGSQDDETKAKNIIDFSEGRIKELAGKPVMLGSGCNFQRHCSWAIFLGIGFKFNDFIQACHRIHRFLQTRKVRIDLIYTESEREVRRILEEKWAKHKLTVGKMTEIIKQYGLSNAAMAEKLQRSMGVERIEVAGRDYTVVNNDSVKEMEKLKENSVDLILTSIPFSTQYEYSPNYADFGHSDNNAHFFEQMEYLTPNLLRALKPGRVAVIHVKDRIVPGGLTGLGYQTVYPFHAETIKHYQSHGFGYMGMITVVTDVVRENNQTYRLGWSEVCKDSSKISCGMPEYLLIFRKTPTDTSNAYADEPVTKTKEQYSRSRWQTDAHGFWRSNGNRSLTPEELETLDHDVIFKWFRDHNLENVYDYEHHVKIGETIDGYGRLPVTFMLLQTPSWMPDVWTDVARMRTLNMIQAQKGKEMHLCPLSFDIADRIIERFTNPGDLVLDPFSGIGSVGYRALLKNRKYYGIELSPRYFSDSCYYLESAEKEMMTPDLFGFLPAVNG